MFEAFFLAANGWMTGGTAAAFAGGFLWGLISVLFSPCHLASIPLMVGYVAGQGRVIEGREAARYALAFTSGLFLTIALVGLVCTLLGRMLGDIGPYWTIAMGLMLVYLALDMLGVASCRLSGGLLSRLKVRGLSGALIMGLG